MERREVEWERIEVEWRGERLNGEERGGREGNREEMEG